MMNKLKTSPFIPVFALCALLLTPVATLHAQTGADGDAQETGRVLEEIVVTAQKRTESLQDVPISIVAFSGDRIEAAGLNKLDELQSYIPNLNVTETGIGTLLFIRGIGSGINQGFEQSVGAYVDGIYRGRAQQARMPFLDIERIEVLRGPQSTLFGKNSIAGALNIGTARPTNTLEAEFTVLFEPDADEKLFQGVISGPLSENINGRLAIHSREIDGWVNNLTLGRNEGKRDEQLLRGTLDWVATENLDFSLKVESGKFDVDGRQIEIIQDRIALGGPFAGINYATILQIFGQGPTVANNFQDYLRSSNGDYSYNQTDEAVLTANYHGKGDMLFTSITGFASYDYSELCDCDFTGGNVFSALFNEDFEQFSQEFRLTSPVGNKLDYIVGVYYETTDLKFFDTIFVDGNSVLVPVVNALAGPGAGSLVANTATPRTLNQDSETMAIFAQGTFNISDRTRLNLGARLTNIEKQGARQLTITDINLNPIPDPLQPFVQGLYAGLFNITNHQVSGRIDKTRFLPSINLQHDLNDNTMAYIAFSRGDKSGGFDARSNNSPANGGAFQFGGEQADSLEIGSKMSFADGVAELNVALYYTEFDDMQVSTFDGILGFNVGNAARAVSKGIELDGRWRATDKLLLSGSLAISDFEFKEFAGQCYFGKPSDAPDGINCSYAGQSNQFIADYAGTLSADYGISFGNGMYFNAVLDVIFNDDYMLTSTLDPNAIQDSYTKLNARVALASADGKWEIALIAKNLTDEAVLSYASDVPLAGGNFGTPGFYGLVEQPRAVALQLAFRY
ncbi:MAG: iron complex outermembrane receptor protein [Rhodothermales bacterium]|jgi:iron complex outermembrane receptor protein